MCFAERIIITIILNIISAYKFGCSHAAALSIQSRFCNDAGVTTYAASKSETTYQEKTWIFQFFHHNRDLIYLLNNLMQSV